MSESRVHEFDYPHASLMRCIHCGRWFHNEADAGEMGSDCPARIPSEPQRASRSDQNDILVTRHHS